MAHDYKPVIGERVYKTYKQVIASRKDNIGIVTLNNPAESNVICLSMYEEVASALREVEADDKVLAVLINAAGKDFSVGIDYRDIPTDYDGIVRYLEKQMPCLAVPGTICKPLIGAVQGRAYAGGRPLVIPPADIVVVADDVRIGFNAINFGSTWVPVIRWAERIVGRTKAREWILTGKDIGAQEAVNTGLVNKAVPLEELNGAAMEYAELIASKAPLPVRATKKAFLETVNMTAGEASNYIMAKYVPSLWTSEDYKNRIATVYTDVFFKEGKFPPNPKWEGK